MYLCVPIELKPFSTWKMKLVFVSGDLNCIDNLV